MRGVQPLTVARALVDTLRAVGVRYLFGNPGTTELPFLDALPDSGLEYVVALQEASAVAAADGYAQASRSLAVASVHVAPGVGNSISILHNAARARSPLLLTAGQQDTRLLVHEPILAADLVQMTEQFTKWSCEIRRADEALPALRRAITVALTPPTGPVFLSLPMDLMTEPTDEPAPPAGTVFTAPAAPEPSAAAVDHAAALLARAGVPVIVAGDGVGRARDGFGAMTLLAERLGARVYGEPFYRLTSFPGDHPLWRGGLYPAPAAVRRALEDADVVLVAGADVFTWFLHGPGRPFKPGVPVIQIADDPRQIGRSYPVDVPVWADVGVTLQRLERAVSTRLTDEQRVAAAERRASLERVRAQFTARVSAAAEAEAGRVPISPAHLMHTLAGLLPRDAIIVDESASSLPHVLRHLPFTRPGSFYGSKTGTLGWAMGAAVGVALADPRRKVVATVGDGSVMYSPQALWTAARHRLPITYVVPNNASYAILKAGMTALGLPSAKRGVHPGMDLIDPEIDYLALARALGVRAERVDKPADLREALAACLAHPGPTLVDVAIDRAVAERP
ncbi:MAG: thiamine pyrophosphate-binding protein [Candidatus Rokuibacteriota bacterium]